MQGWFEYRPGAEGPAPLGFDSAKTWVTFSEDAPRLDTTRARRRRCSLCERER